jgi:protein arginine kinase
MFHAILRAAGKAIRRPKATPVALSTRIRLARNLNDFPFPGRAETSQRREILSKCMGAVGDLRGMTDSVSSEMDDLSDLDKQILVEQHLISPELSQADDGAGLVLSKDRSCCVMINEEDHLRIQVIRNGLDFGSVWKKANALDVGIESNLDYAYDGDLGFLTACPTNLGTGLRASVMMHLPGLVMSKNMDKVVNAVNQLGIAVRGIFGEGSDASGSVFQISNQQTLGESEGDILERLSKTLSKVTEQELNARSKLLDDSSTRILDKVGRALSILRGAWLMQSAEGMDYLSLVRLAVDLGMLPEKFRSIADRLMIEIQPGHVQLSAGRAVEPDDRDVLRAEMLRKEFKKAPDPDFGKGGLTL